MKVSEAYEKLRYSYSVAVYFKNNDELYKYSDLSCDFDDYDVEEMLIDDTARLVVLTIHTPDNLVIDDFNSDFDDKLNQVSRYLHKKYCSGKGCKSCPLHTESLKPCYLSQANRELTKAKVALQKYIKEDDNESK